jgi:hypothetical protein
MAAAPANHPMMMKIRGIALRADKGFIRGRQSRDRPGIAPRLRGAGYGEGVVILPKV